MSALKDDVEKDELRAGISGHRKKDEAMLKDTVGKTRRH